MESKIEDQELEHVYDASGGQIGANKERAKEKVQCGNIIIVSIFNINSYYRIAGFIMNIKIIRNKYKMTLNITTSPLS